MAGFPWWLSVVSCGSGDGEERTSEAVVPTSARTTIELPKAGVETPTLPSATEPLPLPPAPSSPEAVSGAQTAEPSPRFQGPTGGAPGSTETSELTAEDGGVAGAADLDAGAGSATGADELEGGAAGRGADDDAGSAGQPNACKAGKVVHFVYFVEADQRYDASQRDDIEKQAYAFQQYWYEQLGKTFYLSDPVVDVIDAEHDSVWYVETPDGIHQDSRWYRLGNIKTEVYAKLGIRDFDPNHRVVNYPIARFDGRVGGNFGGAWMDGDDLTCIADDGPTYPYDDGTGAHCLGHPVHEFGHLLGLEHEGPDQDCMMYGFYLYVDDGKMCEFSDANVQKILGDRDNEGWLEAMPGQKCSPLP